MDQEEDEGAGGEGAGSSKPEPDEEPLQNNGKLLVNPDIDLSSDDERRGCES